jgi:hypothetical protein
LAFLALPIEVPLTTTLMLQSIADIARHYGQDLRRPESRIACQEVFALGDRQSGICTERLSSSFQACDRLKPSLPIDTNQRGARYLAAEWLGLSTGPGHPYILDEILWRS